MMRNIPHPTLMDQGGLQAPDEVLRVQIGLVTDELKAGVASLPDVGGREPASVFRPLEEDAVSEFNP